MRCTEGHERKGLSMEHEQNADNMLAPAGHM
jgi:hypothetical protein